MKYLQKADGTRWAGEAIDGINHPASILELWTDAELAAIGLTRLDEPQPSADELLAAERAAMSLSFAQLLIGLVTEGWISANDGRAWRDRTALPAVVQGLIATLPEGQRFAAETRAFAPSEVRRTDPLVTALGEVAGRTPAELDDFFRTYVQV